MGNSTDSLLQIKWRSLKCALYCCKELRKRLSTQDYVSCFSLHFFRALAASCVLYVLFHALQKYLKYNKHSSLHLVRHMLLYLNLDITCSSKLTVFLDHLSRTTFRFSEQTMSADNNEGYC